LRGRERENSREGTRVREEQGWEVEDWGQK